MKNIILFVFMSIMMATSTSYACHDVSFVETSAVDNGDGTYTYTFEACLGEGATTIPDETYGFYLDFTGGNLIDYNDSIIGPSTGNVKYPSVPPISGVGDIEYGAWDDDMTSILSGTPNDCILITLTFDAPISSATLGGYQPNYCAGDTETINTTGCFPSTANYTVEITTYNSDCPSVSWSLDGTTLVSNIPTDGATTSWIYCGECASNFSISAPSENGANISNGKCLGGVSSYIVTNAVDSVIALGGGDVSESYNDDITDPLCATLPVELIQQDVYNEFNENIIYWITASETNSDYFQIEYSIDDKNWRNLGYESGMGNTTQETLYNFVHSDYLPEINYYRIKQVDYNGDFEYFNIISIDNRTERFIIKRLNMLGQEVNSDYKGLVIDVYNDGKTIKRYNK